MVQVKLASFMEGWKLVDYATLLDGPLPYWVAAFACLMVLAALRKR